MKVLPPKKQKVGSLMRTLHHVQPYAPAWRCSYELGSGSLSQICFAPFHVISSSLCVVICKLQ